MTKRKSTKTQKPNSTMIIGVIAIVVVLFGAVLFLANPTGETSVIATIQKISASDYVDSYQANTSHILLDVRTPEEFAEGHIAGAVNIPVQELEQRLSEVPDDKEIVVYCRSGNRSATASTILSNNGYNGIHDMGGIVAWQQAGYPIE